MGKDYVNPQFLFLAQEIRRGKSRGKQATREEVQAATREFLARGGKIQKLEPLNCSFEEGSFLRDETSDFLKTDLSDLDF